MSDELIAIPHSGVKPEELLPCPRKEGWEPCGECHLREGEICDICGAIWKEPTYGGIPLSEHAQAHGIAGWHPGDDA